MIQKMSGGDAIAVLVLLGGFFIYWLTFLKDVPSFWDDIIHPEGCAEWGITIFLVFVWLLVAVVLSGGIALGIYSLI